MTVSTNASDIIGKAEPCHVEKILLSLRVGCLAGSLRVQGVHSSAGVQKYEGLLLACLAAPRFVCEVRIVMFLPKIRCWCCVQASTNTLLSHFVSLMSSLWILLQISQKPPVPPESLGSVPARA